MDRLLYEATVDGTLYYLAFWLSGNEPIEPGCDSCIGYQTYLADRTPDDGGEMDFDSGAKDYGTLEDALDDVLDFAFTGRAVRDVRKSDLDPDGFED